LADRAPVLGAARLAEMMAHGPEMRASAVLGLNAALALVADEPRRAEPLAIASAGNAEDPRHAWLEIARVARATTTRDLEMQALHEIALLHPGFAEPAARRELLAHDVHDMVRSWGARDTPAGREAAARHVGDWIEEGAPSQRWSRRERLVASIADRPWLTDATRTAVADVLLPVGPVRVAHPVAAARLGLAERSLHEATWSPSALAWFASRRKLPAPSPATEVFGNVAALEAARLAFARSGRDWHVRRRLAIGLATSGSPAARVQAIAALLAMAADVPTARRELELLLLDAPAAIEIDGGPDELPRATGIVDDRGALLRLLFALPLEPALFLAPDGGGR